MIYLQLFIFLTKDLKKDFHETLVPFSYKLFTRGGNLLKLDSNSYPVMNNWELRQKKSLLYPADYSCLSYKNKTLIMSFETPLLIIVFNRPDKTSKLIDILIKLNQKIFLFQQMGPAIIQ